MIQTSRLSPNAYKQVMLVTGYFNTHFPTEKPQTAINYTSLRLSYSNDIEFHFVSCRKGATNPFLTAGCFIPLLASRSGSSRTASSVILTDVIFPCKNKAACPVAKYRCANGLRRLTAAFPNQRLTFSPPFWAGQGQTGCRCSCSSSGVGIPFSLPAVYLSYPYFVRC